MTVYDLYLESGPQHRRTMVHVLDLLGCVATGATTDRALASTPDAVRAYRRFLRRHGEPIDPDAPFTTAVVEHVTQGSFLGHGSPYLAFGPDLEPLSDDEVDRLLARFAWLRGELAGWAERQGAAELQAVPVGGGRTSWDVLRHVLAATGSYLSAALGSAPGFGRVAGAVEREELDVDEGLRRTIAMVEARVRATTPEQRSAVRVLPAGPRTLRKALRRALEHDWEHLVELSRRPGGPEL
ncbi:MAG TPA: DinB family protein [Thermomicrobiaceae bacterium]|nr:DinB family protein [Thermomicrobiaceae bacterium]